MDIREMIAVLQAYIAHRTGKEVQISTHNVNVGKLFNMYNTATAWFQNNNGEIGYVR